MADPTREAVLADPGVPAAASLRGVAAQPEPQIALTWLARLRWLAPAGQLVAVAAAEWGLGLALPLSPVLALIALTAATNGVLTAYLARHRPPGWLVPAILLLDVGLLTALLALTGGPKNPFCVLYAVHVAMAVVVVSPAWTWGIVAVSVGLFGLIVPLHRPLGPASAASPSVLSVGSWGATALVLALIAFFCGRLSAALRARDRKLAAMRDVVARSERLASLTTLAAGAAHELGTPLGTIAIAAKELEKRLGAGELGDDARLIRDQADRCRRILDRMNADQLRDADEAPQPIEAHALFAALKEELPGDGARRVRFDQGRTGTLRAPRAALVRALAVLLQNALEADPQGPDGEAPTFRRPLRTPIAVLAVLAPLALSNVAMAWSGSQRCRNWELRLALNAEIERA